MLATVTPATSTFTAYTTVTETITKRHNAKRADATALDARQVTISPSAVPTYASACKDAMGFSSACSCWGITRMTTTVATPVTNTTSTVTAIVSVCPEGTTNCGTGCYRLKTNHDNCGACGNACLATQTCEKGVCVQKTCASDADCQGSCVCFEGVNGSGYCAPNQRC